MRELPYDKFYSVYIHAYTFPEINEVIEIDVSADAFLSDTLNMIRKYVKIDRHDTTYVQRLTDMLLAYISNTAYRNDSPIHLKIKKYIEKNFINVFKENNLSIEFNYSNSHLSKIFKNEYNMTPKQYAEQLILKEITVLLHEELSVSDISRKLCFSSPENMCRFFKAAYGCSPSEYIRKFGRSVNLVGSDGKTVQTEKCILTPLRYKNKMYLEGIPTDIGVNDSGYFLLIAPPSMKIDEIDKKGFICDGKKKYHTDRTEKIFFRDKILYLWAVVKECTDGKYPQYNHFAERR
jgi:AraC-like DNA-binding protein